MSDARARDPRPRRRPRDRADPGRPRRPRPTTWRARPRSSSQPSRRSPAAEQPGRGRSPSCCSSSASLLAAGAPLGAIEDVVPERALRARRRLPSPTSTACATALRVLLGPVDEYVEVFDPYARPGGRAARLSDDLADICSDLLHGLAHHAAGRPLEALWWWQFSLPLDVGPGARRRRCARCSRSSRTCASRCRSTSSTRATPPEATTRRTGVRTAAPFGRHGVLVFQDTTRRGGRPRQWWRLPWRTRPVGAAGDDRDGGDRMQHRRALAVGLALVLAGSLAAAVPASAEVAPTPVPSPSGETASSSPTTTTSATPSASLASASPSDTGGPGGRPARGRCTRRRCTRGRRARRRRPGRRPPLGGPGRPGLDRRAAHRRPQRHRRGRARHGHRARAPGRYDVDPGRDRHRGADRRVGDDLAGEHPGHRDPARHHDVRRRLHALLRRSLDPRRRRDRRDGVRPAAAQRRAEVVPQRLPGGAGEASSAGRQLLGLHGRGAPRHPGGARLRRAGRAARLHPRLRRPVPHQEDGADRRLLRPRRHARRARTCAR